MKSLSLKKAYFLFILLFSLQFSLNTIAAPSAEICSGVLSSVNPEVNNELWKPIKWAANFFRHEKFNKPLDHLDVQLMLNSYYNKDYGQPVESGVAEVYDRNGNLLYQTQIITGQVAQIYLKPAVIEALEASLRFSDAKIIRYRHTHPPALEGAGQTYITWKFSEADLRIQQDWRDYLDKDPRFRHLDIEATIMYLDPNLMQYYVNFETFSTYGRTKAIRHKASLNLFKGT